MRICYIVNFLGNSIKCMRDQMALKLDIDEGLPIVIQL